MFMIGEVSPVARKLVEVCKECLDLGIKAAQPWATLGDVGAAIQVHAEKNGFSVVRDFCGHGVGMKFHEDPEVLHYGIKGTGMTLVPGMTFTIEPMINEGSWEVFIDSDDNWTACTDDGKLSAQCDVQAMHTKGRVTDIGYDIGPELGRKQGQRRQSHRKYDKQQQRPIAPRTAGQSVGDQTSFSYGSNDKTHK